MAETVNWMYSIRAQNGPSMGLNGQMAADGYEKISLTLAAAATQDVTIGPGTWADVHSLIVSASDLSGTVTATPTGGATVALDGPLVLIGPGPVGLLGAGAATLGFENTGTDEVSVDIFVTRDATP
jgi:hypothetical protein